MIRLVPAALLVLLLLPAACADGAAGAAESAPSVSIGGTARALYGYSH